MCATPLSRLADLPFLIVGVSLSFHSLIRRLKLKSALRDDVAVGMGSIFFALCESGECIMRDLTERLRMPKGTLSGLVARMERLKWIERWQCPEDGRAQRVRLTAKARAMESRLRARHRSAMVVLQRGLSTSEVSELQRLLGRVLENLRAQERGARKEKRTAPRRRAVVAS